MKAAWETHVENIFKEDVEAAKIVTTFFKGQLQEGKIFDTEVQLMRELERRLKSYCSILQEYEGDFWFNRKASLEINFSRVRHNPKTIAYVTKLIQEEREKRGVTGGGYKEFAKAVRQEKKHKNEELNDEDFMF